MTTIANDRLANDRLANDRLWVSEFGQWSLSAVGWHVALDREARRCPMCLRRAWPHGRDRLLRELYGGLRRAIRPCLRPLACRRREAPMTGYGSLGSANDILWGRE